MGQKRSVKKYDVDTRPLAPFRVGAVRNKSIRSKKRAALAERLLVRETSILVVCRSFVFDAVTLVTPIRVTTITARTAHIPYSL